MPYVYAIAFTSGIVKFGRTSNPYRRVRDHQVSARQQGAHPVVVLISTVVNDLREESFLLDAAHQKMDQVSRESYRYESLEQIAQAFTDCRLSYIACKVSSSPYKLVIDDESFLDDMSKFKPAFAVIGQDAPPNMKVRRKVAQVLRDNEGLTFNGIVSRISGCKSLDVSSAIIDMEREGSVVNSAPGATGFDKQLSKYKETEIARQIYP